ncbi:MAG: GntR family transcriptional regulator [Cellulosilyticaceae bacterium]
METRILEDVKPTKGVALYHKLEEIITKQIKSNQWQENERIPSEKELCEMYNVSRTTVRQAILELEQKGYIYKVHGKGTFVSPKVFKQDLLKFYSFTEEMKKLGKVPTSVILEFVSIKADETISKKLQIAVENDVYKLTRLRLADDIPVMLEYTYLPVTRFQGLTRQMLEKAPMYAVFREDYNMRFTKAIETFKPVLMEKSVSKVLDCKEKGSGMQIERVTYEEEGIVEYTSSVARGDKFEYTVVLE